MMSGRAWTKAEDQIVRREYRHTPIQALVARLRRTEKSVYQRAFFLGLAVHRHPVTAAEIITIRRLALAGSCNRHIGRATGHSRGCIRRWRRKLGLTSGGSVDSCQACKAAVRAKSKEQLRKEGLPSLAYLRIEAHRKFARQSGWPEDLRWRAVQILNVLWEQGPMTRFQIAHAIGMKWKGSRKSLTSNDPGGSYLAYLKARGMVVILRRANVVHGKGKGHSSNIYALPVWLSPERREEHTEDDNAQSQSTRRRQRPRAHRGQASSHKSPRQKRATQKRHV
jgi:hypothetical protein